MSGPHRSEEPGECTVLVSNAEPHFGVAVALHLRERGWEALHVRSAREALVRWGAIRPRWVITGFEEGDVDDFAFLEAVAARAADTPSRRPEVLVCAHKAALAGLGPATRRPLGIDLVVERPCRLDAIEEALGILARGDEETVLMLEDHVDASVLVLEDFVDAPVALHGADEKMELAS